MDEQGGIYVIFRAGIILAIIAMVWFVFIIAMVWFVLIAPQIENNFYTDACKTAGYDGYGVKFADFRNGVRGDNSGTIGNTTFIQCNRLVMQNNALTTAYGWITLPAKK